MIRSFENFKKVMDALMAQSDHDKEYANQLAWLSGSQDVSSYDNSFLRDALISIISSWFEEGAIFQINSFIYDMDFGRNPSSKYPIENLWNSLTSDQLLSEEQMAGTIDNAKNCRYSESIERVKDKLFMNPSSKYPFVFDKEFFLGPKSNNSKSYIVKNDFKDGSSVLVEYNLSALESTDNLRALIDFSTGADNKREVVRVLTKLIYRLKQTE